MNHHSNQSAREHALASCSSRSARPVARLRRRPTAWPSLWNNLEALFEPLAAGDDLQATGFTPAVELRETAEAFQLRIELPGVAREDLELKLDQDVLVLSGTKAAPTLEEGDTVHRSELRFGAFERRFQLPKDVDAEQVHARHANGVLMVTLTKADPDAGVRRIELEGDSE